MNLVKLEDEKRTVKTEDAQLKWKTEMVEDKKGERSLQDLEVSYTNDTKWHEPDATMKSEKDEDSDEFKPIPSTNLTTASGDVMEIKLFSDNTDALESDFEQSTAQASQVTIQDAVNITTANNYTSTEAVQIAAVLEKRETMLADEGNTTEQIYEDRQSTDGASNFEGSTPNSLSVSTEPHTMDIHTAQKATPAPVHQRLFMECVQVPTTSWLKKTSQSVEVNVEDEPSDPWRIPTTPETLTEDDVVQLKRLRNMKQPDVEVEKEVMSNDEGVNHRLRATLGERAWDIHPINLDDECRLATITRAWMTDYYGGSRQSKCPSTDKKFPHGINDFWYMTYEYNPNASRIPGAAGLAFGCWSGDDQVIDNQRVIMRTRSARWTHTGFYRSIPSSPLTQEEWSAQSPSFQNHWARKISEKSFGIWVRTRVGLRRDLGREPTTDEINEAKNNGVYNKMSSDVIKEAFACGQEQIAVWGMECIGYDEDFQRHLTTMPADYVSPMDNPNTKGKKADRKSELAVTALKKTELRGLNRRHTRKDSVSSDDSEDAVNVDEETSEKGVDVEKDGHEDGDGVVQNGLSSIGRPKRNIKPPRRPDESFNISESTSKRRRLA